MIVNEYAARACLADLVKLGVVQFTDLNPLIVMLLRAINTMMM